MELENSKFKIIYSILCLFSCLISYKYFQLAKISSKQIQKYTQVFNQTDADVILFNNTFLAGHSGLEFNKRKYILIPAKENDWNSLLSKLNNLSESINLVTYANNETNPLPQGISIFKETRTDEEKLISELKNNFIQETEFQKHGLHVRSFKKKHR